MRSKFAFLSMIVLLTSSAASADRASTSITISLLDDRATVTRAMDSSLMLRLVNANAGRGLEAPLQYLMAPRRTLHQGWDVEVLRRPITVDSRNLLHTAPHGPDLSDVEAWQIDDKFYPNERRVEVAGYPITVSIALIDPKIVGSGSAAAFTAGELRVSWRRHP